jgi:hypothetical protein
MSGFRLKLGPMLWDKSQSAFRRPDEETAEWAGIAGKDLCRESHAALDKCRNLNGWVLEVQHNKEGGRR